MIPQAHITAWRNVAPWPDDAQVEQDLVLSRATVELFGDADLSDQIALRGGTALNKLSITPGVRFSEDIDQYDSTEAMRLVRAMLTDHLPGDPWRGAEKR